ncbi:TetR/AcrR family transcriptional regulator [Pseudonocardia spinosispora]|uniref:TetR/AcrR family transcriptional regulator n=1 Tax=Pseudonocardia spinosispora TaxID=103441 RepID=UPI00048D1124|nr:TetR/AcrR family transcriptional regulator [Pseudonocardia spinosispora]
MAAIQRSETPTCRPLTRRGLATRNRIIQAAAELIYEHGVRSTTNEQIREAARVSGSQLSHYFPEKENLIRAVMAWRTDQIIALYQGPTLGSLDSFAALRSWVDFYVQRVEVLRGGCSFGSLASEIIKTDAEMLPEIADGFERWEGVFRDGLQSMRERGELRSDADPVALSRFLMAAFQGGMLLTLAHRDISPLRDALTAALNYVQSFAATNRRRLKSS